MTPEMARNRILQNGTVVVLTKRHHGECNLAKRYWRRAKILENGTMDRENGTGTLQPQVVCPRPRSFDGQTIQTNPPGVV